jgi:hypothetical protein
LGSADTKGPHVVAGAEIAVGCEWRDIRLAVEVDLTSHLDLKRQKKKEDMKVNWLSEHKEKRANLVDGAAVEEERRTVDSSQDSHSLRASLAEQFVRTRLEIEVVVVADAGTAVVGVAELLGTVGFGFADTQPPGIRVILLVFLVAAVLTDWWKRWFWELVAPFPFCQPFLCLL